MAVKGIIAQVAQGSLGEELGLEAGDRLLAVNGEKITDIIDLSFALADEEIELWIEKANGEQEVIEFEKDLDEELGVTFESAVFNGVRQCGNNCVFCFVDQMPGGMRESLYVKDDDYRLSFLYGNFVTLSNLGPRDFERIEHLRLSPLYVSVHTTNGELRGKMLKNKRATAIMEQLHELVERGIEFHTQIVLCPGYNDGKELGQTIETLWALRPSVLSMAIVPVGLTQFREGLPSLETFDREKAKELIDQITVYQEKYRQQEGISFVHLADEFYVLAGQPLPEAKWYDGFPQLENGIGMIRTFLEEWQDQNHSQYSAYHKPELLDIVCGKSAYTILKPLLANVAIPGLTIRVTAVENRFFGPKITVTGLLTGQDILDHLKALPDAELRTGVIVPGVALRKGEDVFLDNLRPSDLEKELRVPVRTAYFAADLWQLLAEWR